MKRKLSFFVLLMLVIVLVKAQDLSINKAKVKKINTGREIGTTEGTPSVVRSTYDKFIGQTYYDMWTNSSMASKCVAHADGTVSMAFTACGTSSATRGTGYNYYNGTSLINAATNMQRLEPVRTGWGNIANLADGEIVVSHNGSTALVIGIRPQKGTGTWTFSNLTGPNVGGSTALLWPQVVTTDNIIHVICCTESDPGYLYNGIQTCLVYYRGTFNSASNTITWESPRIVGDVTSTYVGEFAGDSYSITAKGNKVAVLVTSPFSDIFYWISEDKGVNWTRHLIFDSPLPKGASSNTLVLDTPYVTDGTGSIAIGDNGTVHVAFGIFRLLNDDPGIGLYSYFGAIDGLLYWNSTMGTIGQYGSERRFDLKPQILADNGYRVFTMPDLDGDGVVSFTDPAAPDYLLAPISSYGTGVTTMPQIIESNGTVYLTYNSLCEYPFICEDFNQQFFRGIFGTKFTNNGANWDENISWISYGPNFIYVMWENYDPDLILASALSLTENVYCVMAENTVNGKINMLWQTDPVSGTEIKENSAAVAIYPSSINWLQIAADSIGIINNINEVYQGLWNSSVRITDNTVSEITVYPNPATDNITVSLISKETSSAVVSIYNITGQVVKSENTDIISGNNKIRLNINDLSNGFYLVNIKTNNGITTQKFIKE